MRKTALIITFISAQALAQEAPLRMSEKLAVIPPEAVQKVLKDGEVAVDEAKLKDIVYDYQKTIQRANQLEYEKHELKKELNAIKKRQCI